MPSEFIQQQIDTLLAQAAASLAERDWTAVREMADAVLAVDPQNGDASSLMAMAERAAPAAIGVDATGGGNNNEPNDVAQIETQPTSFANGRYEAKSLLGEGGKKKVYLAHDTTLDRDVAFGLIKAEGLDADSRQRITREAQAMARLGDHPNLMPIFDLGEENGQPYMVQPLMVGGDVEALISESEDGRLSLEDALRISGEICSGLEFAHSKGIIHRDLKPGNVWLTDNGTVRIGDYGLALSIDRSRLTQEKMMVGTVSYMPPEQATGGEVTPKADLYSLGAMLYEMVTGRPPFMGDDDIAIIGQHVNTPPVAPSWHNQSLPQTLDSLIMRLLAKDPAERPGSASEVLQALEAIDPSDAAVAHEEGQGSLDSMSGGVFVGRHREMDTLKATFEETLGGHGKMVALVGEPGIGKTRTAQELATYASMRGGQVLWGRCYEGGGAPAYYPWVQAIRSYVNDRDAETVRREMGSTASVISEIVPDVKERLPDVQPPPQVDDPDSARFRLFDSITTFLKTVSGGQPIVLMLEDLHWSDKPSLLLLEFVAREIGNSRVMIVGNYRDMELNRRHPLSITLGELSRERLFERVLLRGLQKHDVQRFIEVAAGIDPPSALVDAVHTQTEGNPLFVTETVRLLIQEGDITSGAQTEGGTSSWEIRIPEGVREVIGRRLDRLSERCNEVLTMASVVGRQFQFGLLMNLVDDASENMLLDVMDEALEARIIEEVPSEVGLYQFAHALMQETLSSELSANRTVRLHARIAEALEEFYGDKADQHAADLVEHFAEAEIVLGSDRLIKYGSVAVKEALRLFAFEEAAYTGGRALQSSSDGVDSVEVAELHLMTGKANGGLRNLDVAIGHFEAAFEMYEVLGDHAGMIEVGSYNFVSGVGQVAMLPLLERAMAIAVPNTAEHGQLLSSHGVSISMYRDRYADGLAEFEQAERIALDNDDHQLLLRVQTDAGLAAQWGSDFEAAFARSKAAVDIARDDDDPLGLSMANVSLSLFSEFEGDREQADLYRSRAIELADRSGDRQRMSTVRGTGARNLSARGDWDAARRYGLESLEFYPEDSRTISTLAMVEAETGNFSEARKYSDQLTGQDEHGFASLRALEVAELSGDETWIAEMVEQTDGIDDTIHQSPSTNTSRDLMRVRRAPYELSSAQMVDLYNEVEQLRHRDMIGRGAEQAFLSIGRLAAACEFSEKALEWFESGLSFARKANRPPNIAWHAYEIAGVLLERGGDGDSERAGELQDEAIAIATELGMKPLLERVLAQREILKA